jgi:hypothetical protein
LPRHPPQGDFIAEFCGFKWRVGWLDPPIFAPPDFAPPPICMRKPVINSEQKPIRIVSDTEQTINRKRIAAREKI